MSQKKNRTIWDVLIYTWTIFSTSSNDKEMVAAKLPALNEGKIMSTFNKLCVSKFKKSNKLTIYFVVYGDFKFQSNVIRLTIKNLKYEDFYRHF